MTRTTGADDSTRRLIEVLIWHGLTEQAAQMALALGETLRQQMFQERDPNGRRELGALLDAQTGDQIGPITAGTRTSVSFAAQIQVARDLGTTSAAAVHTHPGNSPFSEGDAGLLAKAPLITTMAVIGANRTWYVFSPEPSTSPPATDEIKEHFEEVLDHLAPTYRAMVNDGILTAEQAWQEFMHEIWQVITPALGLRYDRFVPDDDGDAR